SSDLQHPQRLHLLVAAAVVDDWNVQLRAHPVQDRQDGGKELGGGDEVDVSGTFVLQLKKDFSQPVRGEDLSHLPLADGIVLAVAAFQGAAGEEDSAASAFPADTGLLPEV